MIATPPPPLPARSTRAEGARLQRGKVRFVPESETPEQAEQRLVGDIDLYNHLAPYGFAGPEWNRYLRKLVDDVTDQLRRWIRYGDIFHLVAEKTAKWPGGSINLPEPPRRLTDDEIYDLVNITVAEGLHRFRNDLLAGNRGEAGSEGVAA